MDVTIAICTYNRAAYLEQTLNSIAQMDVPAGTKWEVVVVNNNCSDATDETINRFAGTLPIRREFEACEGLSNARNRAIAAAQGDYIIWTDDDVVVASEWIGAYLAAFRRWPDAAIFGGMIVPRFEEPIPRWLSEVLPLIDRVFAARDMGEVSVLLSPEHDRMPYGANYAVRAQEQRLHPYDPELGRRPGRNRIGEESAVMEAILRTGKAGYWVPSARVVHCVSRERQTLRYVKRQVMAYGETKEFMEQKSRSYTGPMLIGAPRWLWRQLAAQASTYICFRLTSPPRTWMRPYLDYCLLLGALKYWWSR